MLRADLVVAIDPPLNGDGDAMNDGSLNLLEQSLWIGLIAASRLGLLRWDGNFRVREAVAEAAWDLVDQVDKAATETEGDDA